MTSRPLLNDRFAPITSSIGFIRLPLDEAAEALAAWLRSLSSPIRIQPLHIGFPQSLCRLLPLEIGTRSRMLLVSQLGGWTAYFDCRAGGTDPIGPMGLLAEMNGCDAVTISVIPHQLTRDGRIRRYGAVQFELFGADRTEWLNSVRSVAAVHDGSRWRFITTGTVQPFEQPAAYDARKVADRLTSDLLAQYCAALGFRPFQPDAYGDAVLVESHPQTALGIRPISLFEAQRKLGIAPNDPCLEPSG